MYSTQTTEPCTLMWSDKHGVFVHFDGCGFCSKRKISAGQFCLRLLELQIFAQELLTILKQLLQQYLSVKKCQTKTIWHGIHTMFGFFLLKCRNPDIDCRFNLRALICPNFCTGSQTVWNLCGQDACSVTSTPVWFTEAVLNSYAVRLECSCIRADGKCFPLKACVEIYH